MASPQEFAKHPRDCLRPGSVVRICGLTSATELNGELAACEAFHPEVGRWSVRLGGSGEEKRVKVGNLFPEADYVASHPGMFVRIQGLKAKPELNGKLAECSLWSVEAGRWVVRLEESGEEKSLRPENLLCCKEGRAAQAKQSQRSVSKASTTDNCDVFVVSDKGPPCFPLLKILQQVSSHIDSRLSLSNPRRKLRNIARPLAMRADKLVGQEHSKASTGEPMPKNAGSVKRRRDGTRPECKKKKTRRRDDIADSSFQFRQRLWSGTARVASGSTRSARPTFIDADIAKVRALTLEGISSSEGLAHTLDTDIAVADGLRSPRWLWEALYPYQRHCVEWLYQLQGKKCGGVLADEMGLGKTVQIIAYLGMLHHSGILQSMRVPSRTPITGEISSSHGGILIVSPVTLIEQWQNHIHLWYPPLRVCSMHLLGDDERKEAIRVATSNHGVLITSYEALRSTGDELHSAPWLFVILDEGQRIRNPHASITLETKRFNTPHRIVLSGSPIQNNLQELWSLVDFICPGRLGTLPVFLQEFAQPIDLGGQSGASETRMAAAYHCATALRELTLPLVLRRTKAQVMDTIKLPEKQEEVLLCNMTADQWAAYMGFLKTGDGLHAISAQGSQKPGSSVFRTISALRKICNHPDLMLSDKDRLFQNGNSWSFDRSGKLKVLFELMERWHAESHRVLIFVQTLQMLDVIQCCMHRVGYRHLRIDGKTPVDNRLALIDDFNCNTNFFAMVLTTRVGGVGLNIVGADRVVIFDPDWNPMTDIQARERAWRIGQLKDVVVYRLVLSGTIEEKIYERQVYKHHLSQKVLNDARQQQRFKCRRVTDLFEIPPTPSGMNISEMAKLKEEFTAHFEQLGAADADEDQYEGSAIMKEIADLSGESVNPSAGANFSTSGDGAILRTLFDSKGIKASFNHEAIERPILGPKIVREGADAFARRALAALASSRRERESCHLSEPTWTGKCGRAGAPQTVLQKGKRSSTGEKMEEEASVAGTSAVLMQTVSLACKRLALTRDSDRRLAHRILVAFLDPTLAGPEHRMTTGAVLQHLAVAVAAHQEDAFKSVLKKLCRLEKPKSAEDRSPGFWSLREEFWPK